MPGTIDIEIFECLLERYNILENGQNQRQKLALKKTLAHFEPKIAKKIELAVLNYGKLSIPWIIRNLNCTIKAAYEIHDQFYTQYKNYYRT